MLQYDLVVSKTIDINAPVSKVWDALTNPDIIKDYLFGTETITDWEVGSDIIFQGEYQGQQYRDKGVILENIPNVKISYSYWSGFTGLEDKPENYSTVIYTLASKNANLTTFTWTQKGYANEEAYQHSNGGMDAFVQSIKERIEQ